MQPIDYIAFGLVAFIFLMLIFMMVGEILSNN
ncbi:hypothetical protein BAMBUS_00730 [Brevundimonas phage vB_BpoS-Bambus]|nr:hypothetical protein BAMBUS_00730 [Brevundimonas phage vB_BpoS-Bambus]